MVFKERVVSSMINERANLPIVEITVQVKIEIIIWISMLTRLYTNAHVTLTSSINF